MHTQKADNHKETQYRLIRHKNALVVAIGILSAGVATMFVPSVWVVDPAAAQQIIEKVVKKPEVDHVKLPSPLRAIYMSQCVAGTPSFREKLVKMIDETSLNAVVIDIKDYTGKIAFPTENPILKHSVSDKCGASDMREFVKSLHEKNIFVIGRITVFQDPYYTKLHPEQAVQSASTGTPWKDYKGLSFIDVSSTAYWDYVVELSKEAHNVMGFDELNYDYIRYPSDGPMKDARYVNPNKAEAVEKFWAYLAKHVKPTGAVMSADLFGMAATNYDDLNIGQQLERALPYFDYIMPMVYPSHYPKSFLGLGNPNNDPYRVVNYSMGEAVKRAVATSSPVQHLNGTLVASSSPARYTKEIYDKSKLRPWLQDFDYGKDYTPADIRAQIKASEDLGLMSWIFWDPANRYTELKQALDAIALNE